MSNRGENIDNMNDVQYHQYMEVCESLREKLDKAITFMMHYIFEGKCREPEYWDRLFMNVCRAIFMKDYLAIYLSSIISIAMDFLQQFEDWLIEIQPPHN